MEWRGEGDYIGSKYKKRSGGGGDSVRGNKWWYFFLFGVDRINKVWGMNGSWVDE